MRTPENYEEHLQYIEANPQLDKYCGIKGPSAIFSLVPKLPLTAPIDYMHQVLLGVARTVLILIKDELRTVKDWNLYKDDITRIKVRICTLPP